MGESRVREHTGGCPGPEEKGYEATANGYRASLWDGGKVLEPNSDDSCTTVEM